MAIVLEVIDGINQLGEPLFEVVENDSWRFTSHGFFKTKENAEKYIVDFNMQYEGNAHD